VLKDRTYGVQPASPDEPEWPAVVSGPNVDRLTVHPVHALPASLPTAVFAGSFGQPDHLARPLPNGE
jgi:hypothetical protein